MSGTVTESFLVAACESGPRHAPYSIHKISIALLEQDMHHDVSVWGLLFQFHIAAGMMTPMGFGFATWGEGKGESWRSGYFELFLMPFLLLLMFFLCQLQPLPLRPLLEGNLWC